MKQGIQTFCAEIGESACYALSIIRIAEIMRQKEFLPIAALEAGIEKGFIYYNPHNQFDDNNFFVTHPDKFLSLLTGRKCTVRKELPTYQPTLGEYIIQRWERKKVGKVIGHFRLPEWDSLTDSQTVKHGEIVSLRVFKVE